MPSRRLPAYVPEAATDHAVIAYATTCAPRDEINSLRSTLQLPLRERLPLSLLKYSDEQTVVALAAVFAAIRARGLENHGFDDWGVLTAARYLGREATAGSIQRFLAEGAWGVSPHILPHRSLHSLSGTLSQALGMHGPNFGVGGGLNGPSEIILAATAMLYDEKVPGVWVVMTGWHPELIPARPESLAAQNGDVPICRAAALALTTCHAVWPGPRLRVCTDTKTFAPHVEPVRFGCESLATALARPAETMTWRLSGGGSVELHGLNDAVEDRT